MSDQIQLSPTAPPWLPGVGVESVEVFGYYNRPLLGVVKQHGVPYLFRCVARELADPSIWLYAPLTESELHQLEEADGDAFEQLVARFSSGRVTAAFVDENAIAVSTLMTVQEAVDPNAQALEVAQMMLDFLHHLAQQSQQIEQLV